MKNHDLRRIFTMLFFAVFYAALSAQPAHVYLIGGPINKNNPNWVTSQKIELTKDSNDPSIFYYRGYLAYNWRGDERGNIKFLIADNWDGVFHPNAAENQPLLGTTAMRQDGSDTKWFIPADRSGDGYYKLILNTQAMTLTVDSFRHDLNPDKIYAVGGSMPCGWNNNAPEVLTRISPEVAIYKWSGVLKSGDFKFLHPLSIGNWDFCYDATTANKAVTYGASEDLVFEVRNSSETTFNDFKFIMNETAECTITVDLVNKTMTVAKNGVLYAQDSWITGSAIPGGKAKLVSDNIDPLISYHYYGQLLAGEFRIATTETIGSTTQFYVPTASADAIADNVDVSLTSNASTQGWTVSQANDLYKIKFNTLTKKFKGFIYGVQQIYLVGGATSVGWDAGNAIELTKGTGDQATVYTFDGILTANAAGDERNKFKFLLQKDWGPYSFHPLTENASLTNAQYFTDLHSYDYKWAVDADKQGRYVIKLDALQETIQATYYPSEPTNLVETKLNLKAYATNGGIRIISENDASQTVQVFAVDGRMVVEEFFHSAIDMKLAKGIYIVKIGDNSAEPTTLKIIVLQ